MQQLTGERNWFHQKRFGMFVHWGIYALGGLHEQEQWRYNVPAAQYEKYVQRFDPVKFDPARWLDLFQECGMEYLVFTVKHHDGFCMWDTKETSYNIMNTPYKKDIAGMLAEECHKRNFPLEFYYSCVDWHHPAYPNLGRHHEIVTDPAHHDMDQYIDFLKKQITELCSNYGTIHGIWWDMNVPEAVYPEVNELIRSLQPCAVINNRGYSQGDYSTPERTSQEDITPFSTPVESCESINMHSWGFRKDNDMFSTRFLEEKIALYTALGGNFLLNAGPAPDGTIDERSALKLRSVGKWYNKVKSALTAPPCLMAFNEPGNPRSNTSIVCTGKGKELYLICRREPAGENICLEGFDLLPVDAVLLNTGEKIETTLEPPPYMLTRPVSLRLHHIPVDKMAGEVMTFKLTFDQEIEDRKILRTAEKTSSLLVNG